jgi:hypothetical protein
VRAATPMTLPSGDDLHKQFDTKQYQPLLQNLARVLQLKGTAAQPYDRVDLLMLRGEALLQLKQQASAVEAFDAAAKEATSMQPNVVRKPDEVAMARSMSMLVHQSRNFNYTPKMVAAGTKPQPISLLDLSKRPQAFRALLTDALMEITPKAKAAGRSQTLAPIIAIVRSLGDLRALELTATKETKQSDQLLADLGEQAYKLMDAEIKRIGPAVDKISANAHSQIRRVVFARSGGTNTISSTTYSYRGLYYNDQQDLKTVISTCELVLNASRDFGEATTGKLATQFTTLAADAQKVGNKALQTLNDDYSRTSITPMH